MKDKKKRVKRQKRKITPDGEVDLDSDAPEGPIQRERMVDCEPLHSWVLCRYHPAPKSMIAAPEGVDHPSAIGKAKLEVLKVGKGFRDPDGEPWVKAGDLVSVTVSYRFVGFNPDDKYMVLVAGSNITGKVFYEDIPDEEIEVIESPREDQTSQLLNAAGRAITGAN